MALLIVLSRRAHLTVGPFATKQALNQHVKTFQKTCNFLVKNLLQRSKGNVVGRTFHSRCNILANQALLNSHCEDKVEAIEQRLGKQPLGQDLTENHNHPVNSDKLEMLPDQSLDMNLTPSNKILARFGVITDVQYADTDDKPAHYDPSKTRYYRASLGHVAHAFDHWDKEMTKPTFVLQLGDIIDGLNKRTNGLDPLDAINKTLVAFEAHPTIPTFHAVGNHELYNFKRAEIVSLFRDSLIRKTKVKTDLMGLNLNINEISDNQTSPDSHTLYYKFNPSPKLKIIALDCFEISVIGYDPSHENYRKAEEILFKYHGHRDFDLWDVDDHLAEGPEKRFQQQNGAISDQQLEWLARELEDSDRKGEKVIVFGHVCLHPGSCDWSCLVWNYDKVIETFHRYNCVVSYMSGHAHKFGHSVDEKGIHYIVYHGVIETSPTNEAFATVTIYENCLQVDGYGLEENLNLAIPSKITSPNDTNNSANYEITDFNGTTAATNIPTTISVTV